MEELAKPINCCVCRRNFSSMKSLCGHMRSHPDREWRGTQPPSTTLTLNLDKDHQNQTDSAATTPTSTFPVDLLQSLSGLGWAVTGKRGRKSKAAPAPPEFEARIHEYVFDLTMLANGNNHEFFEVGQLISNNKKKKRPRKIETAQAYDADTPNSYICDMCNISFPTHQALGGHRSSHNRSKNLRIRIKSESVAVAVAEDVNVKVISRGSGHQCNICGKTFPTGQALGGHMRCHWKPNKAEADQSAQAKSPEETTETRPAILGFDLNQPPAIGDEHVDAVH